MRSRSDAVMGLISQYDHFFDTSPNRMNLFNIFKTDEELLYYVRLSALLSDTLKSPKMSTLGFSVKIALCEINKLYALTIRLYNNHHTNVNTLFEETQRFHSEMSVKAFKDNYVLLFETIVQLRIADHKIQKSFISKFFTNVFQSKTPISDANVLINSIKDILNSKGKGLFIESLAEHMLLACSTHLRENSVGTRSTPPSNASMYNDYIFTDIFDDQQPQAEDSEDQESSSSSSGYGSSDHSNNDEIEYDRDTFFDFNKQKEIFTEKSGRSRSSAAMERLRLQDEVTEIFLKELPHEKQIKTLLNSYKQRCRDAFLNMCIGEEEIVYFEDCSTDLVNIRGEIIDKMFSDYTNELTTFQSLSAKVAQGNGQYSYLANCKVFDSNKKTTYSYNRILHDSKNLFDQPNLSLLGTMISSVDWDPSGLIKMPDGHALDLKSIIERISIILCNKNGEPAILDSDFNEVSYDVLKQIENKSFHNRINHNNELYPYKFSVESVVLELPHTEGWQNPLVLAFVNNFLKKVKNDPMSFTVTIQIDEVMEISLLFQRYFSDSVIAYHYDLVSDQIGVAGLPEKFQEIIDDSSGIINSKALISVTKNYEFTPYDEYSCLQIHASGLKRGVNSTNYVPNTIRDQSIGYVYHFNNWTLVIHGNVSQDATTNEKMYLTYMTLINKIPNEALPRQSTSQLRLGPAAGAIPRMYPIMQRQQSPPKEYKLPEGKDWYVFGIVNHNLFGPQRNYLLDTLSFYHFHDVDNETKKILDIGRRIITAEIVQEYYPSIQTLDNMIAYMVQLVGGVKSHHGLFVTFMISASQIQVKEEPPPLAAYSEKWEEYLRKNGIYHEPILEKSSEGVEILNNLRMSRIDRFGQRYNPLNPPNRRNPVPAAPRQTGPQETVSDYAKRANRSQLMPERPYRPWELKSKTNRKGNKRFDGREPGFQGYTAPERTVNDMGLRP